MILEHENVVLGVDLPEDNLKAGDIGTMVLVHRGGKGYEVEFATLEGEMVAVVTLPASQVRRIGRREIAHARALERV